jgi:1-acyl-sn-glycerol-3-phosphate acyltransferase
LAGRFFKAKYGNTRFSWCRSILPGGFRLIATSWSRIRDSGYWLSRKHLQPPVRICQPGYTAAVASIVDWARQQVIARVPKADLDQRDPDLIREQLPAAWLVASSYFRADVRGLDRIPANGPVLLVGNHSGGNMPVDSFVFTLGFCSYFGVERPFYQLAHSLVMAIPGLRWLPKFGTVAASHENARLALESGAVVLVYPGGDYEVYRPSWQRHVVDFGGRKGFVRLARDAGVPIVPVAAVGGQETALFLDRGERLAKLLMLDKMLRLKVLPISVALPWGPNISPWLPYIPLPAKIVVEAQQPIEVDGDDQAVYDKVVDSLQAGVDRLAAERRFPVIG